MFVTAVSEISHTGHAKARLSSGSIRVTHIGDPQFGQVGRSLGSKFGCLLDLRHGASLLQAGARERLSVANAYGQCLGWRSYLCRVRDINSPVPKDVVLSITALNRMNMVAAFAREKVDF